MRDAPDEGAEGHAENESERDPGFASSESAAQQMIPLTEPRFAQRPDPFSADSP
jgi:hypothetical protein